MAELFFIKSPEDFNKSIVPANKILSFVGLSEDGVPTPFYKLPDGSIVQLYQALLDALKGTVVPSSGSGLSYITVESVINNKVIVPGIPASVLLNGTYYTIQDTYVRPIAGDTNWTLDITKILALANMPEFSGQLTVFYNAVDFVYVDVTSDAPLTLTAEEAGSTVKLIANGAPTTSGLQYRTSTDSEFTPYTVGTEVTLTNVDDYVQFQNTEDTLSTSASNYVKFVMTGKIAASGNMQSMLNGSDGCSDYCYYGMFRDCTALTKAPELPATELVDDCYGYMFENCTSLTQAPELPATELDKYCYEYMFRNCTSLTQVPALRATELASSCYSGMFYNCTSLTQAPELPATTLAKSCYGRMFYDCKSLTQAPELPATPLAIGCYDYMFYGCTALTEAPELPATELASSCYSGMFYNCTSLTQAPELPAITLAARCYEYMFSGCTSLTQAPELPATELVGYCYHKMFEGCTSLTQAPNLPATTLITNCYSYMFYGCSNLSYISVNFTEWHNNATTKWVRSVAASGTFVAPAELADERGDSRIPEGWTLTTNEAESFTITGVDTNPEVNGTYVPVEDEE